MCGRYALGIRASLIRYNLQQQGMQVDQAPEDEEARETYNFPPGALGIVYRANVPDAGHRDPVEGSEEQSEQNTEPPEYDMELKVMKWGLIPFWTKRSPDYSSMLRTINCRDDSLFENRGMWNTMKQKKRCIVIAQGFYEWLKKGPGGKDKIPHFVKRKDGNLMCFAGLWDCVKYEDTEEKLYSYTIVTTDSNKQLNFLHDRMPVIFDPNTDAMKMWLDPRQNVWTKDLASLLKPYAGELECYQVNKEVGKVGNNSPDFVIPVDSKENKNNIANFFGNANKKGPTTASAIDKNANTDENSESNAPVPDSVERKRKREDDEDSPSRTTKRVMSPTKVTPSTKAENFKKGRSATSNQGMTLKTSPSKKEKDGTQPITNFFVK